MIFLNLMVQSSKTFIFLFEAYPYQQNNLNYENTNHTIVILTPDFMNPSK